MNKYGLSTGELVKRNLLISIVAFALFWFECKFFNLSVPAWVAGIVGVLCAQLAFFMIFFCFPKGKNKSKSNEKD